METTEELLIEVAEKSLRYYGFIEQYHKTVEECGELVTALMHYHFEKCGYKKVLEEIADVYIMCEQMIMHFDVDAFEKILFEKLNQRSEYLKARGAL